MPDVDPTPQPGAGTGQQGPDPTPAPAPGDGTPGAGTPPAKDEAKPNPAPGAPGGSGAVDPKVDESTWDVKTTAYIKSLRTENASYRTKAKESGTQATSLQEQMKQVREALGIENPDPTVEDFENVSNQNEQVVFRNAVLEAAVINGIPSNGLDYFQYLVESKVADLNEGQELADADIALLATQAKQQFPANGKTSFGGGGDGGGNPPKPPAGGDDIKVEQFSKMTTTEKSDLYEKNPAVYDRLMAEAKERNIFV